MERVNTRVVGDQAETLALQYLELQGLRPVERNYRCRLGEIDLVMLDADYLVFVEVRYRSGRRLVPAVQTVDYFKQRKLGRAAEMYLARGRAHSDRKARFDVVGIDRDLNGEIRIEWIRDAFSL
jgi:putative endonuclease